MKQETPVKNDESKIVERHVDALLRHRQDELKKRKFQEKFVDGVTKFISTMAFFYFHFFLFTSWILLNSNIFHITAFDPKFVFLATFASIEAIFLTIFVLIGQKRMKIQADKWAELDLQVSLLTEHEVTKVMTLVTAIAKKLDLKEADSSEISEITKDIHPEKVLEKMELAASKLEDTSRFDD
jgi:uncharacterized membrane protein